MSRPYIGPKLAIRLPSDVLAAVDRLAEARQRTRADILRRLITHALRRELAGMGAKR